jgi:hypothetical protein
MSAVMEDHPPHPSTEGSPQACAVLLAMRRNGGIATAELLRRVTKLHPADLGDALHGLVERRRVYFDQHYAGGGAWRLGARKT